MIGENFLRLASSILILCLGIYMLVRPDTVSKKIKRFYSNYPIIRYAGEKQLTSRSSFVKLLGIVFIILGLLIFLA